MLSARELNYSRPSPKQRTGIIKNSINRCQPQTHLDIGASIEPLSQQSPCLDCYWGELELSLQYIADGIDIRHVGLLFICDRYFSIPENSFS